MKIKVGRNNEFVELEEYDSIVIIDDNGHEFRISPTQKCFSPIQKCWGKGFEINDPDGSLVIRPCVSNEVMVFSSSEVGL